MTTYPLIGFVITVSIFLFGVVFQLGKHSARLEALEDWRRTVRQDMHEISDCIQKMTNSIGELKTVIEERTERRDWSKRIQ